MLWYHHRYRSHVMSDHALSNYWHRYRYSVSEVSVNYGIGLTLDISKWVWRKGRHQVSHCDAVKPVCLVWIWSVVLFSVWRSGDSVDVRTSAGSRPTSRTRDITRIWSRRRSFRELRWSLCTHLALFCRLGHCMEWCYFWFWYCRIFN